MSICRDHDNRNNSIKRSGILFSWMDRGGGWRGKLIGSAAMPRLLLTQSRWTISAVGTRMFIANQTQQWLQITEKMEKKGKKSWECPFLSHYEEDIHQCLTETGRYTAQWPTSLAGACNSPKDLLFCTVILSSEFERRGLTAHGDTTHSVQPSVANQRIFTLLLEYCRVHWNSTVGNPKDVCLAKCALENVQSQIISILEFEEQPYWGREQGREKTWFGCLSPGIKTKDPATRSAKDRKTERLIDISFSWTEYSSVTRSLI